MVNMNKLEKIGALTGLVLLVLGLGIGQATLNSANIADNESEDENDEPGLVRDVSKFLSELSPAFLIILGVILIVGSGLAKIIGYVLIIYAIIQLIFMIL